MGMSVGSSASMLHASSTSMWLQNRQSFNQMSQALQSGNLADAQKAFSSLSANSPSASDPKNPLAQIGKALQSGDIKAAQQAFSTLRAGHHHQGAGTQAVAPSNSSQPPLATSGSIGTLLNTVA